MGARKVALCFSAASMKMVMMSIEVRNISMKTPWAMDTSSPKVVETFNSPGNMAETTPAAQIPASICEIKHRTARVVVRAPIK
jgi:hypothetical protein